MESLKANYDALPKEEKIKFLTSVMPDVCDFFKKNPQEMMSACKEMMKECNMDMSQMKSMMSIMKK